MRNSWKILLCALPLGAHALTTVETAQIATPPQGSSGQVEAAINGRSGNTDFTEYTAGGRIDYQAHDTQMFVTGDYSQIRSHDAHIVDAGWAHAHYRDEFQHGLAAEAFVDYQQDNLRDLSNRTQLGAGVRFTMDYQPQERALYAGIGGLHEWQSQAGISDDYWRLNSYLTYKRQLSPDAHVLVGVSYQPRTDDWGNYLFQDYATIGIDVSSSLSLQLGIKHEYDNHVPSGIKQNDTQYTTALRLKF